MVWKKMCEQKPTSREKVIVFFTKYDGIDYIDIGEIDVTGLTSLAANVHYKWNEITDWAYADELRSSITNKPCRQLDDGGLRTVA